MIAKGQRGFSVIELMVSVAVSAMIAYAIFAVMRAGQEQVQQTQLKMFIQDSAREGLYKMTQEIRLSAPDRIDILNGGNQIQFSVPDPGDPTNSDFSINWDDAHQIQYALGGINGTQLIRTDISTGLASVIANDVTDIDFAGNGTDPDTVTITVSVQRRLTNNRLVPANPLQMTAQAEIRNV